MGVSRKWILIFVVAIMLVIAFNVAKTTLNDIKQSGELKVTGLQESVKVVRDENGMAYIYAQNEDDLFFSQGFITAQDRLFNMELLRLIATGRLSEVIGDQGASGEKAKKSDIRMRTIGFHRNAKKHLAILGETDKNRFQKYVDGVNAYLEFCESELPLELGLTGIKPTKWDISESLAIIYYMGWGSAANLKTEIISQLLVEKLGEQKARELFPVIVNPDDLSGRPLNYWKQDPAASQVAMQTLKDLLPLTENNSLQVGSNNWVTSARFSSSGKPILANDPHLKAAILPGPFYPIGLITPEIRAIGVNVPGFPGMIAGRTKHLAFGVTNGYADAQDLYVETLYSENPDQYLQDGRSFPLEIVLETLKIKDSSKESGFREEEIAIRYTKRGPIVSGLFDNLKSEKVISLRWSPFESMGTSIGSLDLMTAKSVYQARDALRNINTVMLNFVLADTDGNIAWQTSGRIPVRSEANGTVPFVVKKGTDDWRGWIPWDEMPHSINPEKGWLGTANHAVVTNDYPFYYSSHFAPSWRYSRIKELMSSPGLKSVDDHWAYQRDTKNLMAERITPLLVEVLQTNQTTGQLAEILSNWNFHDDPDQIAPTIFQVFMCELFMQIFEDELGEELSNVMASNEYYWQQRLMFALETGDGEWFDDKRTPGHTESIKEIIMRTGLKTKDVLSDKYGSNPNQWTWGNIHKIEFVSILRRSGFGKQLFGGGSYPMPGSSETLHRGKYKFMESFDTAVFAALRMVVDMGDPEKILAVLPGGVSARILDPHRTDQIKAFMDGSKLYWWFSDQAIKDHTQAELMLEPMVVDTEEEN